MLFRGENFWPYDVKTDRKEFGLVMRYTHEQGLAKRRLRVEEIFHQSTLELMEAYQTASPTDVMAAARSKVLLRTLLRFHRNYEMND